MDFAYMGKVLLSVILLTPGMVVVGLCLFVGLLMLMEKAGLLRSMAKKAPKIIDESGKDTNPSSNKVVAEFKRVLAEGPRATKDA
jgi:hypothetical protein